MFLDRRTASSWSRVVCFILIGAALAATRCSTAENTRAQELAMERWQTCKGQIPAGWLTHISTDGQISFYSRGGRGAMLECLSEAARKQAQGSAVSTPPPVVEEAAAPGR
jgi:hypothetical protein